MFMLNFIKRIFAEVERQPENDLNDGKHLLIMRHASSDFKGDDMNRTLNGKGLQEAKAIAYKLANQKIVIDKTLVSTANRAI